MNNKITTSSPNKLKTSLAALGIAVASSVATFTFVPEKEVYIKEDTQAEYAMSTAQYNVLKSLVIDRVRNNKDEPLTWEEYQLFVELYDHEIKNRGGIKGEKSKNENIIEFITKQIE